MDTTTQTTAEAQNEIETSNPINSKVITVTLFCLAILEMYSTYKTTGNIDFSKGENVANGIAIILPIILGYIHRLEVRRALRTPIPGTPTQIEVVNPIPVQVVPPIPPITEEVDKVE